MHTYQVAIKIEYKIKGDRDFYILLMQGREFYICMLRVKMERLAEEIEG